MWGGSGKRQREQLTINNLGEPRPAINRLCRTVAVTYLNGQFLYAGQPRSEKARDWTRALCRDFVAPTWSDIEITRASQDPHVSKALIVKVAPKVLAARVRWR